MKALFCLTLAAALLTTAAPAAAKKSRTQRPSAEQKTDSRQIEAATRLQIFLDRANFSPGVISGRYDELTLKALALYRQANGQPPPAPPAKPGSAADVNGLDLASFGPAFVPYTVTEADLHTVGAVPNTPAAQAKVKFLPYRNAAEAIAEKFHCEIHFLEQLNPGKTKNIRPGDQSMVALLGQRDELLRLVEDAFSSHIHVRGNEITITGEGIEAEKVALLFEELLTILGQGQTLTKESVGKTIDMIKEEEGRPSEVFGDVLLTTRGRPLGPKTLGQKRYIDAIRRSTVTFAIGPAGTGKTYLAVATAVKALQDRAVTRIILTPPAVDQLAQVDHR